MQPEASSPADDTLTVVCISWLAYMLQDLLHEGLGHGLTAWLSGARTLTISTVALQSDISNRWISANGTLVNLVVAAILWILLARLRGLRSETRYFLVLAMAGNLFGGTGYFFFSGVTNFGDWAAVIGDLRPHWIWQLGLCALGMASYYASMRIVAAGLRPFQTRRDGRRRLRHLTWTPYFAEGVLAGLAGLLNPAGLFYVVASALPSTLGAGAGMLSLPFMMPSDNMPERSAVAPMARRPVWIAAAAIAALLFTLVLGRGIAWSR